jgi:PhzF family phenazine biosynthesis protein
MWRGQRESPPLIATEIRHEEATPKRRWTVALLVRAPLFHLDAFTRRPLAGNPAAVMLLESFMADGILQGIAAENNLGATAFLVPKGGDYRLRWFTPSCEIPLCGHGTLASAAVVMERLEIGRRQVIFASPSGPLTVNRIEGGYSMNFPARFSKAPTTPVPDLRDALGSDPLEVVCDSFNYIVLLQSSEKVRDLAPDMVAIARLNLNGVIVTAADGGDFDFISRYFAPAKGIPEDPVTGSAHCALVPFWAKRLNKTEFRAAQVSRRGGEMTCRLIGDRVELQGSCVFYSEGSVEI